MNILVLAADYPSTTRMPGSSRLFNFCRELSRQHALTLLFVERSRQRAQAFAEDPDNRDVFSTILPIPLPHEMEEPRPSWLAKQYHRLTFEPYFSLRRLQPRYFARVAQRIRAAIIDHRVDLIYVDGLEMTQYLDLPCKLPLAVDFCDSLTLLFTQKTKLETCLWRKLALFLESRSIAAWEKRIASQADLSLLISSNDEQQILRLAPAAKTRVIAVGVDCGFFAPQAAAEQRKYAKLIFTGVMGYGPNADAADYFTREIFPKIRAEHPQAEFWIVGASPPPQLRGLGHIPGVHVTGAVDDVRTHMGSADVFVCPLRYGTGLKNKVLAALAMKLPVVATPLSILGFETKPDIHLLVAEDPQQFAEKVDCLLKNSDQRRMLAENGRKLVEEHYSWSTYGSLLAQELAAAAQKKA